jgi:hypothetical protein
VGIVGGAFFKNKNKITRYEKERSEKPFKKAAGSNPGSNDVDHFYSG